MASGRAEQAGLAFASGPKRRRRPVKAENAFSFINKIPDFLIHFKFEF
jgi:hypothetical protein